MAREPSRNGNRMMRWIFLLALNGVFLFIVGTATVRETYRDWQVDQQIQGMQSAVDGLQGKKTQLLDVIQQMSSGDALDKEARAHLGLKKPGEQVIILRGADGQSLTWNETTDAASSTAAQSGVSNPRKWFGYFFHPETQSL